MPVPIASDKAPTPKSSSAVSRRLRGSTYSMRGCQTSGAGCIASAMMEMTGAATRIAVATAIAAAIRPRRVVRFTPAHIGRKPEAHAATCPLPRRERACWRKCCRDLVRSIIEPDLVHQRRGRLAVGDDLGDRRRIGGELAVARNGRVDGDAGANRVFVVGIGVDLLRLFAGEPLDQLDAVGLVGRVLRQQTPRD